MKVKYPRRLFFDCSTAHLAPATRDRLDTQAQQGDVLAAPTPYGWFVIRGPTSPQTSL